MFGYGISGESREIAAVEFLQRFDPLCACIGAMNQFEKLRRSAIFVVISRPLGVNKSEPGTPVHAGTLLPFSTSTGEW
jgi:hypothetical protein